MRFGPEIQSYGFEGVWRRGRRGAYAEKGGGGKGGGGGGEGGADEAAVEEVAERGGGREAEDERGGVEDGDVTDGHGGARCHRRCPGNRRRRH